MTSTDYNNQLKIANAELETELQKAINNATTGDRLNQYALQDDIMLIYIQKITTILYIIMYILMVYVLYSNPNVSRIYFGIILVTFVVIPILFWLIGKYFADALLWMVRLFIKGNSSYLYAKTSFN